MASPEGTPVAVGSVMRIAAIAPVNYEGYWLGQASREVLVELSRRVDLEVYLFRNSARHETPPPDLLCREIREFATRSRTPPGYDSTLVFLGDDAFYCEQAYLRHVHRPGGIAWIFDETLQRFVQTVSVYRGDAALYRRTMTHCHGEAGREAADLILAGHGNDALFLEYDCLKTVVEIASGVLGPSRHLLDRTARYPKNLDPETAVVPLWVDPADPAIAAAPRDHREVGEGSGPRILCLPGQTREVVASILAWAAAEEAREVGAVVTLEAQESEAPWLEAEAARAGCGERVQVVGPSAGGESDVVVDLRLPWSGERIRDHLKRMAVRRVLVLGDTPQIADLPDEACLRIPAGRAREEVLREGLSALTAWPARREAIGEAARTFVLGHRTPAAAARRVHDFLVERAQALQEKAAVQRHLHVEKRRQDSLIFERTLRDEAREALLEGWDGWPGEDLARAVEEALHEMGLGRRPRPPSGA